MYILKAEKRENKEKAKKLRRDGMIPCSISGGDLKETLLIKISDLLLSKLITVKGKGGNVEIACDGKVYNAMIKEINQNQLNKQIEDIVFQNMDDKELVTGTAQIVLKNRNKVQTMVQQFISEIPYRALPGNLVEEIIIDLADMRVGANLKVENLSLWKNSNVKVLMNGDRSDLNIVANAKA
ncbi:MAG: hypothetical protein ACLRZ7_00310 [Lachnospiraceae bacterium]